MTYDVVIIGGGPGGYTCAIRCAQYGLKTALIEKDELGGTCLNRGCIPTKTLLFSADLLKRMKKQETYGITGCAAAPNFPLLKKRAEDVVSTLRGGIAKLLKQRKVTVIHGFGRVIADGEVEVETEAGKEVLTAKDIVLATGGFPAMPPIPGRDLPGVYNSDTLLKELPALKRLVIIGGGVIGVEFAEAYHGFGAEVSVVEMMPRLLPPFDADLARHLAADFKKKGIRVVTKAAVKEISQGEDGLIVTYELAGEKKEIAADGVLIATGRRTAWRDILPFDLDEEQHVIRVDENGLTSRPHLYAIGDITSGMPQLAHAAEARAKRAAAAIAGKSSDICLALVPQCVYTIPEIASVGICEDEAKAQKLTVSRVMMGANAKSLIAGEAGYMKLFSDSEGKILGGQLMCRDADNLVSEITLAIAKGLTVSDFGAIIRPHPSIEEALGEAAETAEGLGIHSVGR